MKLYEAFLSFLLFPVFSPSLIHVYLHSVYFKLSSYQPVPSPFSVEHNLYMTVQPSSLFLNHFPSCLDNMFAPPSLNLPLFYSWPKVCCIIQSVLVNNRKMTSSSGHLEQGEGRWHESLDSPVFYPNPQVIELPLAIVFVLLLVPFLLSAKLF